MRVRIIFRGLTLFTFENGPTKDVEAGTNMGELTAWLVSDPTMAGMTLHEHKPRVATLGRDSRAGNGRAQPHRYVPNEMTLTLEGHRKSQGGVIVDGSFRDYVPRLGALRPDRRKLGTIVNRLDKQ